MAKSNLRKLPLFATLLALGLTGCASNPPTGPVHDPFENVNRKIYSFNTAIDNAVLKPVARGYRYVLPDFVETGINNFFSNLDDVNVIVNDLLQGKFRQAGSDTGRFLYNSTAGLLGFIDFSTRAGMVKHKSLSARPWVSGAWVKAPFSCCRCSGRPMPGRPLAWLSKR